ncbi:hypothetical protein MLD63_13275 [Paracoccus sp. TK19116]|uniref:Uncharacterized protein n=1 Tax=Paracoccus albicereus TaxID=2922394 RepID=A0ABT1MSW3_9RHOB|nr:hypothetical protein [Paracoccus albicereus]MCQ0971393.1 hypothetical protein [Paracoccus albicereus]
MFNASLSTTARRAVPADDPIPVFAPGWLAVLLTLDLAIIAAHVGPTVATMVGMPIDRPAFFNIGNDWTLGEIVNYASWVALVGLMLWAYAQRREIVFIALAVLFAYCLADDSLQMHESNNLFLPAAIQDLGIPYYFLEIVYWLFAGSILIVPMALGWWRASPPVRRAIVPLLALFGGVVICAVAFDLVHSLAGHVDGDLGLGLSRVSGVFEDGGEMVFMSAMLAYAIGTFGPKPTATGTAL